MMHPLAWYVTQYPRHIDRRSKLIPSSHSLLNTQYKYRILPRNVTVLAANILCYNTDTVSVTEMLSCNDTLRMYRQLLSTLTKKQALLDNCKLKYICIYVFLTDRPCTGQMPHCSNDCADIPKPFYRKN